MAEKVGMHIVFYIASLLYTLACLTLLFIRSQQAFGYTKQKQKKGNNSFLELLKSEELLMFSLFFASIMFIIMLFRPFVPQFLAGHSRLRRF